MKAHQQLTTSATPSAGRLRVGCSGGRTSTGEAISIRRHFRQARWLEYYAQRFDTVEINNSFYRLPDSATFLPWREPRAARIRCTP